MQREEITQFLILMMKSHRNFPVAFFLAARCFAKHFHGHSNGQYPVATTSYRMQSRVAQCRGFLDSLRNEIVTFRCDDAGARELTHLERLADLVGRQQADDAVDLRRIRVSTSGAALAT